MEQKAEWLTQKQVCELLSISQHTLRRMKEKGLITVSYPFGSAPPVGPGPSGRHRLGRISRAEVEALMKSSKISQYRKEE